MNYYNEFDPQSAAWIQELINRRLIPDGHVDTRSITEISPSDLHGYIQCHFFAGIAGWSLALRIAGIPATRPLWTGSCPCQPFSVAGEGKGTADERHLWPVFFNLIRECKPPLVFGEQVASAEVVGSQLEASFVVAVQSGDYAKANKIAKRLVASKSFTFTRRWVDGIQADLETADYAMRFGVLGAHSVGAPHLRQRLYWGAQRPADSHGGRLSEYPKLDGDTAQPGLKTSCRSDASRCCEHVRLADSFQSRLEGHARNVHDRNEPGRIGADQAGPVGEGCESIRLGCTPSGGLGIIGDASFAGSGGHAHGSGDDGGMDNSTSPRCDGAQQIAEGNSREKTRVRLSDVGCSESGGLVITDGSRRTETGMRSEIDSGRELESGCSCGGVGDTNSQSTGRHAGSSHAAEAEHGAGDGDDHGFVDAGNGLSGRMADTECNGRRADESEWGPKGGNANGRVSHWDDAYWHPCRDGKYRRVPVESVFFTEFNGLSSLLGTGWDLCIEEISNQVEYYVENTKISRFEILREVWIAVREETLRREIGGPDSVPFPAFLLFAMCQLARNTKQEVRTSTQDLAEIEEGTMRILRQDSGKFEVSSCPPHQRRLVGSSGGKPEDSLCKLSSEVTPESGNKTVQLLFSDVSVEWNVREALAAVQEVWRRHTDESSSCGISGDLRAASGIIQASGGFPLASPEGFKVQPRGTVRPGLLKGAGNAIVPALAAEFVKAFNQSL